MTNEDLVKEIQKLKEENSSLRSLLEAWSEKLKEVWNDYANAGMWQNAQVVEYVIKLIEHTPITDVEKVRYGKWIEDESERRDDGEIYDYCCSLCKSPAAEGSYGNHDVLTPYCSQCGAEMINGEEG